jgi:hypothetical protein
MWLVQDKRRNGTLGICRCWFEKKFGRFRELGAEDIAVAHQAATHATGTLAPGQRVSKRDYQRENGHR